MSREFGIESGNLRIKLVLEKERLHIISAYALQANLDKETRRQIWILLYELVQEIPLNENVFLAKIQMGMQEKAEVGKRGSMEEGVLMIWMTWDKQFKFFISKWSRIGQEHQLDWRSQ